MAPTKDDPPLGNSTPKIAIKGFSLASKLSSNSKPGAKPPPASSLGKRPRSTFQAHDESDSENEAAHRKGKHEVVTGFGEGGAIRREDERRAKEKEVLVIPTLKNRDWRGEARAKRGKNLLPPEVQRQREAAAREHAGNGVKAEGVDVVNSKDGEIQWGLSVRKREGTTVGNGEVVKTEEVDIKIEQPEEVEEKPKTADEEALAALLGEKKEKKGPDLVIPTITDAEPEEPVSEADAYKRAIASAPDVSTLEDYERVPVEEFGAALLRGMGWKGEKKGQVRDVKRRQNLLGLGAKELKDAEELGAWVQKSDTKRLNERRGGGSGHGGGDRRPKVSEYKREKERREEKREERGGGGYRRERERERDGGRYRDGDRHRDQGRDRDRKY